jgi:hypothetical protein
MRIRFIEITSGEELLITKCQRCNTGFAVAAMSKTYSGMLEARCFDCDASVDFYTSKQGADRKVWALAGVELQRGPLAGASVEHKLSEEPAKKSGR